MRIQTPLAKDTRLAQVFAACLTSLLRFMIIKQDTPVIEPSTGTTTKSARVGPGTREIAFCPVTSSLFGKYGYPNRNKHTRVGNCLLASLCKVIDTANHEIQVRHRRDTEETLRYLLVGKKIPQ
jgi:hypothetical protein